MSKSFETPATGLSEASYQLEAGLQYPVAVFHCLCFVALMFISEGIMQVLVLAGITGSLFYQLASIRKQQRVKAYWQEGQWYLQQQGLPRNSFTAQFEYISPWLVVLRSTDENSAKKRLVFTPMGCSEKDWRKLHVLARGV